MRRPGPRGPFTARLDGALSGRPPHAPYLVPAAHAAVGRARAAAAGGTFPLLADEDVQLGLTLLYELHHRGLDGIDDRWEWAPDLIAARAVLEGAFETDLRAACAAVTAGPVVDGPHPDTGEAFVAGLFALAADEQGPLAPSPHGTLSTWLARTADVAQWREALAHRSVYHLKEADPHTWAVPRLRGGPKAALVEIQADEYGGGRPERMHSALFATTMRALGLSDAYGTYVDAVPATTLATTNAVTMFGLHRRLRGAVAGHLAAFEMTSSLPNRLYGNGLRRLGFGTTATAFFDEHVEADAVHEQVAGRDLAAALAAQEPDVAVDVVLGARACLLLDAVAGRALVDAWAAGRSSLRGAGGADAVADDAPEHRADVA